MDLNVLEIEYVKFLRKGGKLGYRTYIENIFAKNRRSTYCIFCGLKYCVRNPCSTLRPKVIEIDS